MTKCLPKQLREEKLVLAHSLRMQPAVVGEAAMGAAVAVAAGVEEAAHTALEAERS